MWKASGRRRDQNLTIHPIRAAYGSKIPFPVQTSFRGAIRRSGTDSLIELARRFFTIEASGWR
jgi:hypothetical protein